MNGGLLLDARVPARLWDAPADRVEGWVADACYHCLLNSPLKGWSMMWMMPEERDEFTSVDWSGASHRL